MRQAFRGGGIPLMILSLAACSPAALVSRGDSDGALAATSVERVERDVEAPQVFSMEDRGLWDGRPSLGGVWVAAPGVEAPERVIIRNESNGRFVIGALFQREREVTGPPIQLSSDAADALGMAAGAPATVTVVALRKEAIDADDPDDDPAAAGLDADAPGAGVDPDATPSSDVVAAAIAAIDAPDDAEGPAATPLPAPSVEVAALATPAPTAPAIASALPPPSGSLARPYVQIGYFSERPNALDTAEAMRQAGLIPTVVEGQSSGRTFWRVIVGPAISGRERAAVIRKVRGLGFGDAYAVGG